MTRNLRLLGTFCYRTDVDIKLLLRSWCDGLKSAAEVPPARTTARNLEISSDNASRRSPKNKSGNKFLGR